MPKKTGPGSFLKQPMAIAVGVAFVKLLLFAYIGNRYGYFRDELYFLACARHLAAGYPDHAPLSVYITSFSSTLFGESLYAIRLFPAFAGAFKIVITGLIVKEFGGRHLATLIACLAVLAAPVYLSIDNLLSMNAYEPIFWMGFALSYIWAVNKKNPNCIILMGAFAGLGLMNKHSIVFFGAAFVLGLLLTTQRSLFARREIWIAGLAALVLFLPNLIWQYQNDWATLELLRNVQESGKNVVLAPHEFILQQILLMHPLTLPVWLAGIWFLLAGRNEKRFRPFGIAFILLLVMMIGFKAKNYYMAPVYPLLMAAGAVFWEGKLLALRTGKVVAGAYVGILVLGAAMFAPVAVPLLPVETLIRYQRSIGFKPPKREVSHTGELQQIFADMFGWKEMASRTAEVYYALPDVEKERTAILAENYGEAGAIDHFGRELGLPNAISGHQSYYFWGWGKRPPEILILLGFRKRGAQRFCGKVEKKRWVGHRYSFSYERFNILVCRDLKTPLPVIWKQFKNWN